jgi:hypothetical protein
MPQRPATGRISGEFSQTWEFSPSLWENTRVITDEWLQK